MRDLGFLAPVPIVVGLGYPAQIESVLGATAFLNDRPSWQKDRLYSLALKACRAALAGEIEAETARTAFAAFARRHGLLAYEDDHLPAILTDAPADARTAVMMRKG